MQTKVKYSVFPHIKGFFKDKTLRNRDKKLYLCTTKLIEMLKTLLITLLIVAICIALLSIGIFLKGKFPNTHVSGNKALRKKRNRLCAITRS